MLTHKENCGHCVNDNNFLLIHVIGDLGHLMPAAEIHSSAEQAEIKPSFACSSWAVSLVPTGLGSMLTDKVDSTPAAYCTIVTSGEHASYPLGAYPPLLPSLLAPLKWPKNSIQLLSTDGIFPQQLVVAVFSDEHAVTSLPSASRCGAATLLHGFGVLLVS